jgi:hypothetical protein
MRRFAGVVAGFVVPAILVGCGAGSGRVCTMIGARVGVGLDVEAPLAATVTGASLRICWDGGCQAAAITLAPATAATAQSCSGTDPDDACQASAAPTGGLTGFADMSKLPKKPVQVTVVLRGTSEDQVFDQRITVTPKGVFPNGPDCGEGGPQAHLMVVGGRLRERS